MEAAEKSLVFLATQSKVVIPYFQRAYVWKLENWEELFQELLKNKTNHFLGSLIFKQNKVEFGAPRKVVVIDGQQRLTTLSILLKALYESINSAAKENIKSKIEDCLFYKLSPSATEKHVKISHSRVDRLAYKEIITNGKIDKNFENSKIAKCYQFFLDQLSSLNELQKTLLVDKLLNDDNKMLVVIDLNANEDEQTIFDTINSAGVRLSSADIIKNALFQKLLQSTPKDIAKVESLYKDNWEAVFHSDEQSTEFWAAKKTTGRLTRDNIEIFLLSFAIIEKIFDPNKHRIDELSKLFKEKISNLSDDELVNFVINLKEYAIIYKNKIINIEKTDMFSFFDNQKRLYHILHEMDISTFHPYLLFLYKKYENDDGILEGKIYDLERFIVRSFITSQESKNYNKLCLNFIDNDSYPKEIYTSITDISVRSGLEKIANNDAKIILFWIELSMRFEDNKQAVKDLQYNYSLEHVLPQKWEQHWSDVDYVNFDGSKSISPLETNKANRYKLVYQIGNMILLNGRLNTSLKNYDFKAKIDGKKNNGIKKYSDLLLTKEVIANDIWNEQKIHDRTNEMYEKFILIW